MSCSGESRGPRKAGATELMGDSYSENYSSFHSHSRLEVRSVQGKKVEPHLEPCPYVLVVNFNPLLLSPRNTISAVPLGVLCG